jgi:hypothetical protein
MPKVFQHSRDYCIKRLGHFSKKSFGNLRKNYASYLIETHAYSRHVRLLVFAVMTDWMPVARRDEGDATCEGEANDTSLYVVDSQQIGSVISTE